MKRPSSLGTPAHSASNARCALPAWLPEIVLLCVAVTTFLVVTLGPPVRQSAGTQIREPSTTAIEPSDRMALLLWLGLAIGIAFISLWGARRERTVLDRTSYLPGKILLAGAAVAVAVAAVTWRSDVLGLWHGIEQIHLAIGVGIAVLTLLAVSSKDPRWRLVMLVLSAAVVAAAASSWLQTPSTLADPHHFKFTSDEISSVAAGHFPLSDYIPQYTVILPYFFALPLWLSPAHAPIIILSGLLLLQLAVLLAAVLLPCLVDGRRYLPAAILLVVPGSFVPLTSGVMPASYFQTFPMRYAFPVATILAGFAVLGRRPEFKLKDPWPWVGLGALGGLTALNDPGYGLAAAATLAIAVIIVIRPARAAAMASFLTVGSMTIPFIFYQLLGMFTGRPVDWSKWLLFPQVFGLAGFNNVPMAAFGLHVAIVALFATTAVSGFVLIRTDGSNGNSFRHRQGVMLALVGGWCLLTLPYLVGRSVPAVYVQGYVVSCGMAVVALLPLIVRAWKLWFTGSSPGLGSLALSVVAMGALIACYFGLPSPSDRFEQVAANGPIARWADYDLQIGQLERAVALDGGPTLSATLREGRTVQVLELANLTGIMAGVPAVNISSSPEYIAISPVFSEMQCRRSLPEGTRFLLLETKTAGLLAADPACKAYARWGSAFHYGDDGRFALIPVQSANR